MARSTLEFCVKGVINPLLFKVLYQDDSIEDLGLRAAFERPSTKPARISQLNTDQSSQPGAREWLQSPHKSEFVVKASGEVLRGETMLYSGTDPESYITECALVYEYYDGL